VALQNKNWRCKRHQRNLTKDKTALIEAFIGLCVIGRPPPFLEYEFYDSFQGHLLCLCVCAIADMKRSQAFPGERSSWQNKTKARFFPSYSSDGATAVSVCL